MRILILLRLSVIYNSLIYILLGHKFWSEERLVCFILQFLTYAGIIQISLWIHHSEIFLHFPFNSLLCDVPIFFKIGTTHVLSKHRCNFLFQGTPSNIWSIVVYYLNCVNWNNRFYSKLYVLNPPIKLWFSFMRYFYFRLIITFWIFKPVILLASRFYKLIPTNFLITWDSFFIFTKDVFAVSLAILTNSSSSVWGTLIFTKSIENPKTFGFVNCSTCDFSILTTKPNFLIICIVSQILKPHSESFSPWRKILSK